MVACLGGLLDDDNLGKVFKEAEVLGKARGRHPDHLYDRVKKKGVPFSSQELQNDDTAGTVTQSQTTNSIDAAHVASTRNSSQAHARSSRRGPWRAQAAPGRGR